MIKFCSLAIYFVGCKCWAGYLDMHVLVIAELFFYAFICKKTSRILISIEINRNQCKLQISQDYLVWK